MRTKASQLLKMKAALTASTILFPPPLFFFPTPKLGYEENAPPPISTKRPPLFPPPQHPTIEEHRWKVERPSSPPLVPTIRQINE